MGLSSFYNPFQLKCRRSLHIALSLNFMVDSRKNILNSIAAIFLIHSPTLTYIALSCYAVISLSATSVSPFISFFEVISFTFHYPAFYSVVEKSLICTCVSSGLWQFDWGQISFIDDRSNRNLMNVKYQVLIHLFSVLLSISGVNVTECQHCTTATTHWVHQTFQLNFLMILCWQGKSYYHGFMAERNSAASQQMSFWILTKPPTEMRREVYHYTQLTHIRMLVTCG